ncbi:MAG: transposase [Candidatus Aenigmarchaeota archaeon]|nr:transposase [Candidatus Aenigmarchaeota archaeon]
MHSDEICFREDGKNGYVWRVFTKTKAIFFAAKSRSAKHFRKLIRNFKGVIVVDGYRGYNYYPVKQRCWVHLIREFKELAKNNKEIDIQFRRLLILYETLKDLNTGPPIEDEIKKAKWILADIVACLEPIDGSKKIRTYIKNSDDDWFTALYYSGVPLHNNHAERELRSVVLLRKTIGYYRNWKGKRWIDIVISTIHTWRLQGQNIFQNLRAVQT